MNESNTKEATKGFWFHVLEIVLNLVIIIAVVVGIRTFLVSPFQVDGESMANTLEDNQYIIINKLAYYIGTPERGDVVVLRPPTEDSGKYYVKRIIGVPGDAIVIRDGFVYVQPDGSEEEHKLEEEYLNEFNYGQTYHQFGSTEEKRYSVPEGHYFILGDNRRGSLDSRSFTNKEGNDSPYVPKRNVKGKVWYVVLPITNVHAIQEPEYGI